MFPELGESTSVHWKSPCWRPVARPPQRRAAALQGLVHRPRDRDIVRKHVGTRTEGQPTGSTAKAVICRGEHLPEPVEVEEFPENGLPQGFVTS
jgi:hypothetical protein